MADGGAVTIVTGTINSQWKGLFLESFTAVERLSEPFRISCDVSFDSRLDLAAKLGSGVSLTVQDPASKTDQQMSRGFHGLLMEASEIEEFDNAFRYNLVLRPWLSMLQLGRKSRIYQQKSVRDIIAKVFQDASIDSGSWEARWQTRGTLAREYCVQYNESDFDFVSRLMEEEGIYYFFEHTSDKHVMVLCDSPQAHKAFAGGDVGLNDESISGPHFWSLTEHVKPTPTVASSRDAHFMNFGTTYDAKSEKAAPSTLVKGEVYTYPGTHTYLTADGATTGDAYAGLRLKAFQAEQLRYLAEGNVFAVSVGSVVNIVPVTGDHASRKQPVKIMVTGAVHSFSGQQAYATRGNDGLVKRISVEGVPSDGVWLPLLRTPKPVARGPQVATVAGPANDPIHTDDWGRVRVLFPWDRDNKGDGDASSCWLRVATSWAGAQFGELFLPRVGTEVIVDFLEGDMDRPFVSGAAYNSQNTQAQILHDHDRSGGYNWGPDFHPNQKTVSGWLTKTVYGETGQDYPNSVKPPPSDKHGYNMLSFEDMAGQEKVTIRAQRDMTVGVFRDETRWIGQDRKETVGHDLTLEVQTGDETRTVTKGKRTTTIQQDESLEVKEGNLITTVDQKDETHTVKTGKRTTSIKMNDELTVTDGDRKVNVQQGNQETTISMGNMTTEVNIGDVKTTVDLGNVSLKASTGKIEYEALTSIELKVGANSIKIDMSGVTINGVMIKVQANAMGTFDGGGMTTVKGGVVMIN